MFIPLYLDVTVFMNKRFEIMFVRVLPLYLIVLVPAEVFSLDVQTGLQSRRNSRYFTEELILPPLPLVQTQSSELTSVSIPYGGSHNRAIPAIYTNSPLTISNWLAENVSTSGCILGFDVESNPSTPWTINPRFEGPSTVQLATTDSCLVVHLFRKAGRPSIASVPILEAVLSDQTIIKAGVGIDKDLIELSQAWGALEARSRLNLGGIGVKSHGKETTGLKRLSKAILNVDLLKSRKLAASNWSQVPLSDKQVAYCARDAWAGAAVVQELIARDPDTFSPASLKCLLENQQSIEAMTALAMERKLARTELTSLMAPFQSQRSKRRIPSHVRRKVTRLQGTIKASKPKPPLAFDVSSLGITIERSN